MEKNIKDYLDSDFYNDMCLESIEEGEDIALLDTDYDPED